MVTFELLTVPIKKAGEAPARQSLFHHSGSHRNNGRYHRANVFPVEGYKVQEEFQQ